MLKGSIYTQMYEFLRGSLSVAHVAKEVKVKKNIIPMIDTVSRTGIRPTFA